MEALQSDERFIGYLKAQAKVIATADLARIYDCPPGEDLFVLQTMRKHGAAIQKAADLFLESMGGEDKLMCVLPGVANILVRSAESANQSRGVSQDQNCLANHAALTGSKRTATALYDTQIFLIGRSLYDKGPLNFENLVMQLLRDKGFLVIPTDFYDVHADLWPHLFGIEYHSKDKSDRGLNEGFVTTLAAWKWLFNYLRPLQSGLVTSVDQMKRKLGW
jgi:hypothetical protein